MNEVRFDPQNALTRTGGGRAEVNSTDEPTDEPEQIGPIAERVLDDLAARRTEALNRLRRGHQTTRPTERKDQP